ncbi:MAG: hypothetical protein LJE64_14940 [Desulfofustis sp.]|nr:hypothetical protein [Desulfofustis sp.]
MRTCVTPQSQFAFAIHKPSYAVRNLRGRTRREPLGTGPGNVPVTNGRNYPDGDVEVAGADWIFEIANPFPFRGTTFISKTWADKNAEDPGRIRIEAPAPVSLHTCFRQNRIDPKLISDLPRPLLLGLATTSTDPDDLTLLAAQSCNLIFDDDGQPLGLRYHDVSGKRAMIEDFELFEAVANNPHLPDAYKVAMVIRPGAQGASEIIGDFHAAESTHIYEYLRRNSYIGGGHYAANMADDAIRYRTTALTRSDITGLRHLYYQRTYVRLADALDIPLPAPPLAEDDLENLRRAVLEYSGPADTAMDATLWGWNFGFDFSPSGYRLHASHQQIHQQYAMIPTEIDGYPKKPGNSAGPYRSFSAGDMIDEVIACYNGCQRSSFFNDYCRCIAANQRMDGRSDRNRDLVVWHDSNVLLFVPKAQTSQWELQLMTRPDSTGRFVGNLLEADRSLRRSLDTGILYAQQTLASLGAAMVTSIEYSKRFSSERSDHPLIYSFMPKLPHSPGAFSEAQLRFINGHFPEDFAAACRSHLRPA